MLRNLDINLIRTFVAVAGSGNMTAAAGRLGLTQGAVSQQVMRLEDGLQVSLFDRHRRKLKLTKPGERLLEQAKRLLDMNDEIIGTMAAPDITGVVRLGVPYDLVATYLPIVLRDFAETNPRIEVSLSCDASPNLIAAVGKGDIDIALAEEPADAATGECLCTERLLWIGRPEGSAPGKRPLPLSIVSETCVFRPAIHDALEGAGIEWRTVFENGNLEATMTTVRADLAVTASLASAAPQDLKPLTPRDGLPPLPSFSICLHQRPDHEDPAVDELADHIRNQFSVRSPVPA